METLIKTGSYYFTPGSRQITVTGDAFTKEDIRVIINETQKVVITSSMQKDLITSVVDGVITFANSLPVLASGDVLTIKIDYGVPQALAVASEIQSGKEVIVEALRIKGQMDASINDSFSQLASKIQAVTGNITVTSTKVSSSWHDMAYEIASWADAEFPYALGVLLHGSINSVFLTGADKYKVSDGQIYSVDNTITISDTNEIGREDKSTKYIIYRKATPFMSVDFGAYPNISMVGKILLVYNYGMDLSNITFNSVGVSYMINDEILKNPIVTSGGRKSLVLKAYHFQANPMTFSFPPFTNDATYDERTITIPSSAFATYVGGISLPAGLKKLVIQDYGLNSIPISELQFPNGIERIEMGTCAMLLCAKLNRLVFPSSLKYLSITGSSAIQGCGLTYVEIPSIDDLNLSAQYLFNINASLAYVKIGKPKKTFVNFSIAAFNSCGLLARIELEQGWNWTVNLTYWAAPNTENVKLYVLDRLVDKRGDGVNATTCSCNTASKVITFTNGNCLNTFVAGQTITPSGASALTIASVDGADQITVTAFPSANLTDVTYNVNKTLSLDTAVKTALSNLYGANWADAYTAKGWTIA